MPPGTPRTSPVVFVLTVIVALSVCAIGASIMVPAMLGSVGGWPVLSGGIVGLIGALSAVWVIQKRRDRTLR